MITLTKTFIHDSFSRIGLDPQFLPIYEAEVTRCYNELQRDCPDNEESTEDDNNVASSIQLTDEYICYYAQEIEKGHSSLWSASYAKYLVLGESEYTIVQNAIDALPTDEEKEHEFYIHAKSISTDPIFLERYKYLFDEIVIEAREQAEKYCNIYHKLINKGKSHYYAHAYADAINENYEEMFCEIYAKAYELAREHEMSDMDAFYFGDCCTDACDCGYWISMQKFLQKHSEDWQKDFYLYLICEEYKEGHNKEMSKWEMEEVKKAIYK
jgi:hypothetical protein